MAAENTVMKLRRFKEQYGGGWVLKGIEQCWEQWGLDYDIKMLHGFIMKRFTEWSGAIERGEAPRPPKPKPPKSREEWLKDVRYMIEEKTRATQKFKELHPEWYKQSHEVLQYHWDKHYGEGVREVPDWIDHTAPWTVHTKSTIPDTFWPGWDAAWEVYVLDKKEKANGQ